MADVRETERLQPSLLDRLTDEAPEERRETRDRRVIDVRRLREIILRDLSWLLNTASKDDVWPLDTYPEAARSTVNYGIVEIAGSSGGPRRLREIEAKIRNAILVFEPRILPGTLVVAVSEEKSANKAVIAFDIRGDVWAQPLPLEIYMRTELDVTTGTLMLERRI